MKSINRILNILYKEINIVCLFENIKFDYYKVSNYNEKNSFLNTFDLGNKEMQTTLINMMQNHYPYLYSCDEIRVVLDYYCNLIKLKKLSKFDSDFRCGGTDLNTAFLFSITSDRFLKMVDNKLTINFSDLISWESLINDADIELLKVSNFNFSSVYNDYWNERHDNARLYKILKKGYSDNHMHLNASGFSVEINYASWLTNLENYNKKSDIVKLVIRNEKEFSAETEYIYQKKIQIIRAILAIKVYKYYISNDDLADLYQKLSGKVDLYDYGFKMSIDINKKSLNGSEYKEIINSERQLINKIFNLLAQDKLSDIEKYIFNIYLSFKTQFKFYFVQDNKSVGFHSFKKYEDRKMHYINNNKKEVINSVLEKYYQGEGLKSIEIRIAPKSKMEFQKIINDLTNSNNIQFKKISKTDSGKEKILLGIVIHFIKRNYSYIEDVYTHRHSKFREELNTEKNKIISILESEEYNNYGINIIGIDAANEEIMCRPEHLAVVFREIRNKFEKDINLGFTYHVGEEFLTVSSGLRAIDETIIFMNYKRGDRLGHAVVLGIKYEDYYSSKDKVVITNTQDYIDDLAWILSLNILSHHEHEFVKSEVRVYLNNLYEGTNLKVPEIDDYIDSLMLRGDSPELYLDNCLTNYSYDRLRLVFPNNINHQNLLHISKFQNLCARKIYCDYHYNIRLKRNGMIPVFLNINEIFVSALTKAQMYLKEKIKRMGIIIETNPSSNKKISYAKGFQQIMPTNFNSKFLSNSNNINIPVTISADDSSIFQTTLEMEYSYVAKTLIDNNYDEEEVYNYIDYLRNLSLETTFLR